MKIAGIIAEYDPFHNGHAAQIQMLRERGAQTVVVCMSSGAVQRGAVPLLPEWTRVRAALESGADLVLALPAPYACSGAEAFAAAGVRLLAAAGCDTLAFGAETPDAGQLLQAAALLRGDALRDGLRRHLATGMTFAAARAAAADELCPGAGALLARPNNILGVEYCKAILAQGEPLQPLALPRLGADHNGTAPGQSGEQAIASASYLRTLVRRQGMEALRPYLPGPAFDLYRRAAAQGELADPDRFGVALLALLRSRTPEELARVRGLSEGLEHRLAAAIRTAADVESLYSALKTKRYPHARLRRLALDAAMGCDREMMPELPPYLHVLGARRQALPLLKQARLPASTSLATLARQGTDCAAVAALHSKMVDFSLFCREKTLPMGLAFTAKPVVL